MNKLLALAAFSAALLSCKKENSSVSISAGERKLIGVWRLQRQTLEAPGQLPLVSDFDSPNCFINFRELASPQSDGISPLLKDTKLVEDNKDCTPVINSWKIDGDGKLLLVSADTVYADIELIDESNLRFKAWQHYDPSRTISFEFTR